MIRKILRFRNLFTAGGSLLVLAYLLVSDPLGGSLTIPFVAKLATPIAAVLFAHWARKALFDYLDMGELYRKAKESATGAGLAFVGLCIVIYGLLGLFGTQVYAQSAYVPKAALAHLPTLKQEQEAAWSDHPKPGPLRA